MCVPGPLGHPMTGSSMRGACRALHGLTSLQKLAMFFTIRRWPRPYLRALLTTVVYHRVLVMARQELSYPFVQIGAGRTSPDIPRHDRRPVVLWASLLRLFGDILPKLRLSAERGAEFYSRNAVGRCCIKPRPDDVPPQPLMHRASHFHILYPIVSSSTWPNPAVACPACICRCP